MNNKKFLNLILLKGNTEKKMKAAHEAGFNEVEIWYEDVKNSIGGADSLAKLANELCIKFTNLQVLHDFTGAPGKMKNKKRSELHQFIQIAQSLGCNTIQAPASTLKNCIETQIDDDLVWMAEEASKHKMYIMYEPLAWSKIDNSLPLAWKRLKRLNQPNIGLVIDLFHISVLGGNYSQLNNIPMNHIYEVQLCDMNFLPSKIDNFTLLKTARHKRLLPGEGIIDITSFIDKLKNTNYNGPIGIEVFNDDLKKISPFLAAKKALEALNFYWK